jgi:hypothetical protein
MISIVERCRGANASRTALTAAGAFALALLPAAQARAGVEYVTRTTNCTSHIADGSNALTVQAGPGMTFEVWGNSVDLAPSIKTGGALTGASIVARHSGADNSSRGCGFVGSMVVSVTSNATITTSAAASLAFQMPLGDFSTLGMTIVPFPALNQPTWTTSGSLQPSTLPCIVGTGSITTINQDTKLVIQLPPGASQDQSTCTSNVLTVRVQPGSNSTDVAPTFKYSVSGLPAFVTESQTTPELPGVPATLTFTFNVAAIRALTTSSTSTVTIKNPIGTNRSTTLTMQVNPSTVAQGFSAPASPNPSSTAAGNPIDFTLKFAAVTASAGQVITWRMTQAGCFKSAGTQWPYNPTSNSGFQFYTAPGGVTSTVIRVISQNNAGCTNKLAPVNQIFEAWIGDQRVNPNIVNVTTGPTYTKVTIGLLFP